MAENILKYSPNAIIIVISNPMDTMTYLALQSTGLPKNRIIGMGGTLDSARFKYQLSQHLGCSAGDLNAVVIGGHGDTTMIPLIRHATWNSAPVTSFLTKEQQDPSSPNYHKWLTPEQFGQQFGVPQRQLDSLVKIKSGSIACGRICVDEV